MADLFSHEWMSSFQSQWNAEPELAAALEKINFSSIIAYGFDGEKTPRAVLIIDNGKAVGAEIYNGQKLNWDLRASFDDWNKWLEKPPGVMGLGLAYTSRKLKFNVGDYTSMIRDPRMASPFIKSFSVMGRA